MAITLWGAGTSRTLRALGVHGRSQSFDTFNEDLKAARPAVLRQELRHAGRATSFLEFRNQIGNYLRRLDNGVRISIPTLAELAGHASLRARERLDNCARFTDIPRFKLPAHHSDKHVAAARFSTELAKVVLDLTAVSAVLILHDDETHIRFTPSPEFSRYAPSQVPLAIVGHTLESKPRKKPRQQPVKQVGHRELFYQEHQLGHYGSAPSNNRCRHNSLGLSPSATKPRSNSLSLAL